jgi:hypothetical protein
MCPTETDVDSKFWLVMMDLLYSPELRKSGQ